MLGNRLKYLRGKRTQDEIANMLGISRARYSHYENGRSEPDSELLQKMADLFNVSTDFLLGRTNEPDKVSEKSNLYFFDREGLTDEDIKYLEESIEIMKERARKRAEKKKQRGGD